MASQQVGVQNNLLLYEQAKVSMMYVSELFTNLSLTPIPRIVFTPIAHINHDQ
jgi:hypothetical protein